MAAGEPSSGYISFRKTLFGFRFKAKSATPRQSLVQNDNRTIVVNGTLPNIPRQAHNPAVHPLLAKPFPREENFVLLPIRSISTKRKRDPNSPARVNTKPKEPKAHDKGLNEWNRYLSSYTEVRRSDEIDNG
jgi:hypothetical protein